MFPFNLRVWSRLAILMEHKIMRGKYVIGMNADPHNLCIQGRRANSFGGGGGKPKLHLKSNIAIDFVYLFSQFSSPFKPYFRW